MKIAFLVPLSVIATVLSAEAQSNVIENASSTYRLPTVTVYGATNESQSVIQSANSVTVLSGQQVRPGAITQTRELGTYLPNVTVFDANNDRIPKFSIRGLRENNFSAGEPVVGFYVDDIPYTDLNSRGLALFDVEQIEFLRGPQGTLFGASGPGGVVNIVTHQPGNRWEGQGNFTYGNYDQQIYEGGVSGPIVADKLSIGVSGIYSTRDGFVHNSTNHDHPDDKETLGGRAQLRWTPTEQLDFSVVLHGEKFNDGFVPTYYRGHDRNLFSVKRDYDGFVDTDTWGAALKGSFANDVVKVTSVSSYRNWRQNLKQDFDFSADPIRLGFSKPDLDQWSQEVRVQSNDDSKNLKWLAGLFYSNGDLRNNSGSDELAANQFLPPPPNVFRTMSDTFARTYALFGQATYTAWEKVDFTAGLRFTYDDRFVRRNRTLENAFIPTMSLGAWSGSENSSDISPKFGIDYHVTPDVETYASVSRSYQAGGLNSATDLKSDADFNPSHSWNFEAGLKSKWLEDRLLANVAVFYTDTRDYQIYRINGADPTQAYIVNADHVSSYGAEFDMTLRPCTNLDLSAAFGATEAEFNHFTDKKNGTSFDHNDVNFVPEFTANIAAQYRFPFNIYARVEFQSIGQYYLDEANSAKQAAYGLFNARLGYHCDHFEIYVFGKNLFDKRYVNNALDLRSSQPGFEDLLIRQPGDPRIIGIGLSANF
jgi:iron complex outermembrane receptor protein